MRLNVFTVYLPSSAYVMRAIDMLFNKRPLTYLLTYLIIHKSKLRFFGKIFLTKSYGITNECILFSAVQFLMPYYIQENLNS